MAFTWSTPTVKSGTGRRLRPVRLALGALTSGRPGPSLPIGAEGDQHGVAGHEERARGLPAHGRVLDAARVEDGVLDLLAAFFPGLAESLIRPDLEARRALDQRLQVVSDCRAPGVETKRRVQGIEMVAAHAPVLRLRRGPPDAGRQHLLLCALGDLSRALGAAHARRFREMAAALVEGVAFLAGGAPAVPLVAGLLRVVEGRTRGGVAAVPALAIPDDTAPGDRLKAAAVRAGHLVDALVAPLVPPLDVAHALHRGRAGQVDLAVALEGPRAAKAQLERIPFAVDIGRVAVDLIVEEKPHARLR